jgi:hypothetical protein
MIFLSFYLNVKQPSHDPGKLAAQWEMLETGATVTTTRLDWYKSIFFLTGI